MTDEEELRAIVEKRIGSTVRDRYRLDRLLGVGGMAAVYRGVDGDGHTVAVKILHPSLAPSASTSARFLKEASVANAIDHPGVVRVLDSDRTPDGAFLVMELLEGESVDVRSAETGGRLPIAEVCDIALAILGVLEAAHARGIIHRDIKPPNVFLTNTNEVKILDFGIARMHEGPDAIVTQAGAAMGTPAYMPPEQAQGLTHEIDPRTDLWAVGAMMFTLITNEYVHQAETPQRLLEYAVTRPARPILSLVPTVPTRLARVIDRALAFDKKERFASAAEMRAAIERALSPFADSIAPVLVLARSRSR